MTPIVGRVFDDLREYFTLQHAEERASKLSAETRSELRRDLELSIQKREAAELLWQGGSRAEALHLAKEALSLVERHAELAPEVAKAELGKVELPTRDDDVRDEHVKAYHDLVAAQLDYHRAFSGMVLEREQRKVRSTARTTVAVAVVTLMVVFAITYFRRFALVADASGSWGPQYLPANAVDGNESTHWLLPDKTTGWLDVKIVPPKQISTVSILNGYDPPGYGVVDYRVEAYSGNALVKGVDGKFPPSNGAKPPWVDVAIDADRKIDRVRIVVKSFHDLGASIAEVKVK